jgi:S-adenosylmethionine:tRNA ribosyltransferase-isomerase
LDDIIAEPKRMNVDDFDFDLPDSLIAQDPSKERGESRLLVLHRTGGIEHTAFPNLAEYLVPGDLLVVNNTRVFPARLLGHRVPSGGGVECLLLRQLPTSNSQLPASNSQPPTPNSQGVVPDPGSPIPDPELWDALVHPGQKLKPGAQFIFERDDVRIHGEVITMHFQGRRTIRLWTNHRGGIADAIDRVGHIPLPPYIKRADAASDRERYQTVYARERGSVAAPTAGLHFTAGQLASLALRGVERVEVTLHVGYGTFKPVKVGRIEDHVIDSERFMVPAEAAAALTRANRERRRIIAVGTTSVRALESLSVTADGEVVPASGETLLFIRPGHRFQLVDGMITNFHLPKSSLLMLVSAFAGRERIIAAYREAVDNGYRFYSYGDAMLIL